MKHKSVHNAKSASEDDAIAVIGIALRFPQSRSVDEFWNHLVNEHSLITEVPANRWDKDAYIGDPRKEGNKTSSVWGGFVEDVDCFDAPFFKISPREAELMDPHQRMALELAWEVLEDAGLRADRLQSGKTGVFMGMCNTDYAEIIESELEEVDPYIPTGIGYSILANRISYFFDFKGPSITSDGACASSLVSIHQAVRSLQNGECNMALAGGVNICWSPKRFIAFSKSGMLSPQGSCKAFDQDADGYVRGEGGAILLLKPLAQALEDKNRIYGLIRGSGVNHGGRTNALTVTNPKAQAEVISDVCIRSGVRPETLGYIETHGPGTPLGDPIEILGLKNAFSKLYDHFDKEPETESCGLGSVKTNIGHLEAAAGIAGVVKVLAAMKHGVLPASLNFRRINPMISLEQSPFYIVDSTQSWKRCTDEKGHSLPLRAGVSAFSFGGTNAHLVLEEHFDPQQDTAPSLQPEAPMLVPLSAKNPERLQASAQNLLAFLQRSLAAELEETVDLQALAATLQLGREPMPDRVIFCVRNISDLVDRLAAFIQTREGILDCWQGTGGQDKETIALFSDDEEMQALLDKWLLGTKLDKLATLWVKGLEIPWERLYGGVPPKLISLPSYPFERKRYWVQSTRTSLHRENSSLPRDCVDKEQLMLLQPEWRAIELEREDPSLQDCILVGCDADQLATIAAHNSSTRQLLVGSDDSVQTLVDKLARICPLVSIVWLATKQAQSPAGDPAGMFPSD